MGFNRILNQEAVKDILKRAVSSQRLAHAYLFVGPEGVGKDAMAIEFAKLVNCLNASSEPCDQCVNCRQIQALTYPGVKLVFATPAKISDGEWLKIVQRKANDPYQPLTYSSTSSILIDRIRELRKEAGVRTFEGKYRIAIISEAERMTQEAANALLKLLEEPPEGYILILTSARPNQLLPTIISRCQLVKFSPIPESEIIRGLIERGVESTQARVIARLAMGNFRKAIYLTQEDYQEYRKLALELIFTGIRNDPLAKLDFIETLTRSKDRGKLKEILQISLLWLRDAYFILQNQIEQSELTQYLYNYDRCDEVQKLAQLCEKINLEKTISAVEKSIDLVEKNVYINLVLITLVNQFSQN